MHRRQQVDAGRQVPGRIETGRWYDVRIELAGDEDPLLPGRQIDPRRLPCAEEPLYAVASRVDATGEIILKVVNVSRVAQDTEIDLRGVQDVESTAKAIVLTRPTRPMRTR